MSSLCYSALLINKIWSETHFRSELLHIHSFVGDCSSVLVAIIRAECYQLVRHTTGKHRVDMLPVTVGLSCC